MTTPVTVYLRRSRPDLGDEVCKTSAVVSCMLCASEPASTELHVTSEPGDAFALPSRTPLGPICLALFESGDDVALAARLTEDVEDFGASQVVALLRRRAVQTHPSVSAGRDQHDGFASLDQHTGVGADLGPLWPAAHRISRVDLRERADDPDDLWLVRSPWEALTVPDVFTALWRWVERDPYPHDEDEWVARVLEFFGLDELDAMQLL